MQYKSLRLYACLMLLFTGFSDGVYAQLTTTVSTESGMVSGHKEGYVTIFKGIPFAAPPVGELRWKAPQPVKNWSGVLKCDSFSASPMQNKPVPFMMWSREFITPPDKLSEDCLYLNIWTPARSNKDKMPVFVWIYGGGFTSGSAACDVYDGDAMARNGIVFVSFNYRVGVFGFLAHPELSAESPDKVSGNYGLLDQVAALKWIRKNITAFGGDPDKVTIAGQSAGSMSVGALVVSPLTKGLFRGAIMESGGIAGSRFVRKLADAEMSGAAFMKKLNAANIAELRKISAEELVAESGSAPGGFGPNADGYMIPTDIMANIRKGDFNQVDMIAGWVSGDASLMGVQKITPDQYLAQVKEKYGDKSDEFLKYYPGRTDSEVNVSLKELNLMQFAALPAQLMAVYNKHNTYLYEFSHVPADKPGFPNYGAFHTSEVPFALRNLHKWDRPWRPVDYSVELTLSEFWCNFTRTGNPNGIRLPEWQPYIRTTGIIMEMGDEFIGEALMNVKFQFLDSLEK